MEIEHITYHLLQGRIILQIELVMPLGMVIRDAMELAKEAEREIFKVAPDITHVSFQLRLGRPIPKLGPE
uniref:Metal tolerance protein 2 isoform X1 n=1 Tax=Rhizophora mucronata TaxID=61149 RepID=A0A2P2JG09_RHIMU